MVDRKRRRHSLYDDTIVSEEPSTSKTPRRTPEQTAAPVVIRTENSPARSLTSSVYESTKQTFKGVWNKMPWPRGKSRKGKSVQRYLTNGDASTEQDHLPDGAAPPVPMKEVSQLGDGSSLNGHLDGWQIVSNGHAGPSTRSRTRSRSPNPSTPKAPPRQALMSESPPDAEHLVIPSSTEYRSLAPSTQVVTPASTQLMATYSTQPPSTLSTQPDSSGSTQPPSTLSTQPTSTLSTQPTSTLSTNPPQSTSHSDTQLPPSDHVVSSGTPSDQASEAPSPEDDGDLGEGTQYQPIELGDSDEEEEPVEAGPSRPMALPSASRTPKRAPPSRPDLTGQSRQRSYSWMEASQGAAAQTMPATPPPAQRRAPVRTPRSTQRRTTNASRKSKSKDIIVRHIKSRLDEIKAKGGKIEDYVVKASNRYVRRLQLQGGGRHQPQGAKYEDAYKRQSILLGDNKKAYTQLLEENDKRTSLARLPTADEVIRPALEPPFSLPASRRIVDLSRSDSARRFQTSIDDIRERFEKQRLEDERKVQARVHPKAPTRMSDARAKLVRAHLSNPAFKVEHLTAEVKAASLSRLRDGQWLDDEIINFYGSMIQVRADRVHGTKAQANGDKGKDLLAVHFFNSFFYKKLSEQGYESSRLKRWSKKFDLFAKDIVIFPINIGNMHWTVGAINLREKRVEYYDSLSDYPGKGDVIFQELFQYLRAEHQDKKGSAFDESGWSTQYSTRTPQQNNGSDCGVFTSQTLEALSRGKDLSQMDSFDFGPENMEYFRKLMVLEIAQAQLEPRWPKEP